MYELALFAGAGGGILGGKLLGWKTVCAVEIEPYPASVLCARQNDGVLPPFPVWDDIRTFRRDNPECAGMFDALRSIADQLVISGGFPCQDISAIGNGAGIDGERSGLFFEMSRVICEIRPRFAFLENSPRLITRGIERVLGALAEMGYDARWGVLGAYLAGLDHKRERIWIVADSAEKRRKGRRKSAKSKRRKIASRSMEAFCRVPLRHDIPAPDAFGNPNGVAGRMDRLQAVGNGQVPAVDALAWEILSGE